MRHLRWLLPLLVLAAAVVLAATWHPVIVHLSQETGTSNAASRAYDFWSGFGSDLGEVALLGAFAGAWHKVNCEVRGCLRIGRHKTAAGHAVCRRHHPDGAPSARDIRDAHHRALGLLHHGGERLYDAGRDAP